MAGLGGSSSCPLCASLERCRGQLETTAGSSTSIGSRRLVDCRASTAFRCMQCRAGMAEHARRATHAPFATWCGIGPSLGRTVPLCECRARTFHRSAAAAPGSNFEWSGGAYPQTAWWTCEQTRDGEPAPNKWHSPRTSIVTVSICCAIAT